MESDENMSNKDINMNIGGLNETMGNSHVNLNQRQTEDSLLNIHSNTPRKRSLTHEGHTMENLAQNPKHLKKARYAWQVKTSVERSMAAPDTMQGANNKEYNQCDTHCVNDYNTYLKENCDKENAKEHTEMDWSSHSDTDSKREHEMPSDNTVTPTHGAHLLAQVSTESQTVTVNRHANPHYWQNEQLAKSIVDNAINKTLEELGLCPNSDNNQVAQQTQLESQSLRAAISSCGLHHHQAVSDVWPSHNRTQRPHNLTPIIAHLTRVSESITHNILQSRRLMERSVGQPQVVTSETQRNDTTALVQSSGSSTSINDSQSLNSSLSESESESTCTAASEDSMVLSQNDLLTQAVTAAICEKGLALSP